MFTPLSKGSERAQDDLWDNSSPRKTRIIRHSSPTVLAPIPRSACSTTGSGSIPRTTTALGHGPCPSHSRGLKCELGTSMSTSTSTTFTANGHLNGNSNRNRSRSRSRNRNPNPNTNGHESGDGKDHHANAKRGTSLPEPVPSNKSAGPTCWSADNSGKSGRGGENAVKGGEKKEDWDGDGEGLASISGLKRGGEEERPGNGDGNGGRERHGVGKKTSSQGRRSFSRRARSRIKGHANQKLSSAPDSLGRRAEATAAAEGIEMDGEKETLLSLFFQPRRERVEGWMDSFWKRHAVLVVVPCLIVWIWLAIPFPVTDPYKGENKSRGNFWVNPWKGGNGKEGDGETSLPLDVNFYFFLFWYFGMYLAVALFFITNLFSLYRLNWWPSRLGGKLSYTLSWSLTLLIGLLAHHLDLFYLRKRWKERDPGGDDVEWERKTFWVVLSFVAMLMPAVACFSKLKRDKRHTYRHPLPAVYQTFFGQAFSRRFPASWVRFLWFMTSLAIASFSLIVGQAYASLFLTTLPHTSLDAGTWVWSWVITVQLLAQVSFFILGAKVRSRALLFIYRLFFQLVYHVFYRNLFARLRSPTQFATVQLLSSISTILIFPIQMSRPWHRLLKIVMGYPNPWEEHVDNVAMGFYCRGLAQNVTMVGFLGWISILHFGPNSQLYPFFRFHPTPEDPYTFPMTFIASCVIWSSELFSSFIARQIMSYAFRVNVSQIGINEMKDYPELVPACGWASVHVSMNILLFLIKLNFR
ncbi:hypothetical protein I308_104410 [Cryptococcus tetragattii IND107]|uniref:Transmembrane protein n=1 Tax=Cryptococcus tetragattii IND107 TaxID=1296105 RepID=A0ABR3BSQ6_9TREE